MSEGGVGEPGGDYCAGPEKSNMKSRCILDPGMITLIASGPESSMTQLPAPLTARSGGWCCQNPDRSPAANPTGFYSAQLLHATWRYG